MIKLWEHILRLSIFLLNCLILINCNIECHQACSAVSFGEKTTGTKYLSLAPCLNDHDLEPNICSSAVVTSTKFLTMGLQKTTDADWFSCHDSTINQTKMGLKMSFLLNLTHSRNYFEQAAKKYKILIKKIGTINNHMVSCSTLDLLPFEQSKLFVAYKYIGLQENKLIKPGEKFQVIITDFLSSETMLSVQNYKQQHIINFSLSYCEDHRYERTYLPHCQFAVSLNMSCNNKTFDIFYHIPHKRLFASANIFVYHSDNVEVMKFTNQSLSGIIPSVPFPKLYHQHQYYFDFWASKKDGEWSINIKRYYINFTQCLIPVTSSPSMSSPILIILVLSSICSVIVLAFISLVCKYNWCVMSRINCYCRKNKPTNSSTDTELVLMTSSLHNHGAEFNKTISKRQLKIYLIFVDDHPKHRDVVLNFACFLQHDLSFDVIFELYQFQEICNDPTSWMLKSLSESDKMVVIWSPGATKRWNMCKNANSESIENDMFSPILQKIERDLFHKKNLGKYFFAYFDYCTKDDIPQDETFCDSSVHHFKLMLEFEKLYFQLSDEEKYLPGIVKSEVKASYNHYYDPNLTKYGLGLKTSISNMCAVVKENGWCVPKSDEGVSNINLVNSGCNIEKNILHVSPPTPLEDYVGNQNMNNKFDLISTTSLQVYSSS